MELSFPELRAVTYRGGAPPRSEWRPVGDLAVVDDVGQIIHAVGTVVVPLLDVAAQSMVPTDKRISPRVVAISDAPASH